MNDLLSQDCRDSKLLENILKDLLVQLRNYQGSEHLFNFPKGISEDERGALQKKIETLLLSNRDQYEFGEQ